MNKLKLSSYAIACRGNYREIKLAISGSDALPDVQATYVNCEVNDQGTFDYLVFAQVDGIYGLGIVDARDFTHGRFKRLKREARAVYIANKTAKAECERKSRVVGSLDAFW